MFTECFYNTSAKASDSLSSHNIMTCRIKMVAIEMSNFEAFFTSIRLLSCGLFQVVLYKYNSDQLFVVCKLYFVLCTLIVCHLLLVLSYCKLYYNIQT